MRGEITSKNPARYQSPDPPSPAFLSAKSGAKVTDENVHNGRKEGREEGTGKLQQEIFHFTHSIDLILSAELSEMALSLYLELLVSSVGRSKSSLHATVPQLPLLQVECGLFRHEQSGKAGEHIGLVVLVTLGQGLT